MKKFRLSKFINTRIGFMISLIALLWAKSIFAYLYEFDLGIESAMQYFILFLNPIASSLFIVSIGLYVRRKTPAYITMFVLYTLATILLFANVVYYGEFTDFLTVNTVLTVGKVSSGLGDSALQLFKPVDIVYVFDLIVIPILLGKKVIKMQEKPTKLRLAFAITVLSAVLFSANLFLAEADRPQLLSRTFSRDYIVKYLGINAFSVYDGVQTYSTDKVREDASANDIKAVKKYVSEHYAAPDDSKFGIAKGKNVIYIHLESFQQFLIGYKVKDKNGVEHEVTPFLNSIFNSNSTYSFDNFFHQVKAGRTSDAENLLETSTFGLNQGSLFSTLGSKNTFEAAPSILGQTQGYTSASFHSNIGSFWNRTDTYKNLGYDYFFDSTYYNASEDETFQYGMFDKPFFKQSIQYLEQLQQPFYAKFLTVTNHFPYSQLDGTDEDGFPETDTGDETIDDYFKTANYLDTAVEEFFNYLKASGLYDNSVIVLYGDHYGISNSRNKKLATLMGKTADTWTDYDNAQMQRVPYMIHIPGQTGGGINHTYGGEIDALPTLLHLLGVDTTNYVQLGQDLFSSEHEQLVAFRDGDYVTPNYTYYGGKLYDNKTGKEVTEPDENLKAQAKEWKAEARKQLDISDELNNGNLLRFDTTSGLKAPDSSEYDYRDGLGKMKKVAEKLGVASTSLYSKNGNKSTVDLYKTETYKQLQQATTPSSSTSSSSSAAQQ